MCSGRVINHKHLVFLQENEEIVFHALAPMKVACRNHNLASS